MSNPSEIERKAEERDEVAESLAQTGAELSGTFTPPETTSRVGRGTCTRSAEGL